MNEEQTWILQAQNGNDEAFTCLIEVYQTPVYNLCYRMLGEPEAAEDAAQETFLRAYQSLLRYDRARPFATWLLSIAAHYCIDRLRRRRFTLIAIKDGESEEVCFPDPRVIDPEAETERRQEQEQLHTVLRQLDATDRAAVILRYWYDFSEAEIAESLRLTIPAVKSRLHRARRQMAKLWLEASPQTNPERIPHESPAF
ncbi:MAG: RNA polymerase sigma factor [Candidatus Villigracilaceae bacterium]